ncbi:chaperone modulator CbpM [Sneathiella sp.]|uniref:chaperone modulator CbpM n=1 Tax=Sneathiella sp. TaxID=1964365 RepID=UPI00262F9D93|nr:chaperone modulator CbpM [Sneathiella sp.]MDF2368177.1 chaperone modulator CbpM [Sneathiella sp.]
MISEKEVTRRIEGLTIRRLRTWVSRGWVEPALAEGNIRFREVDIARIELIRQLKSDMDINNAAVPIVLSLLDQLHGVRFELRSLAQAVESQHRDVQAAILSAHDIRKRKDTDDG